MLPPLITFLIVLSILVFFHEFGHFLAAKKTGIKVLEFGFGYPPRVWAKKIGETIYSLNWIPFGGFVRLLGQERTEKKKWSQTLRKRAFFSQPKKAKILVLLAGVFGNFLLGTICFSIIYSKLGIPRKLNYVEVVEVVAGSPADQAGLKNDIRIISVNQEKTRSVESFVRIVEENKGREIMIETEKEKFYLTPRENPPENEGRLGVMITDTEMKFYPWWQMPFLGAWEGTKEAIVWSWMIFRSVILVFQQLLGGTIPELAGPVGIFQLTTAAAKEGILTLVQFVGLLSINLAVLNLLPFPALDGGHLMFLFLGKLVKGERRDKIEHVINTIGFIFLVSLMILVTVNDLMRLFKNFNLASFLESLF